MGIVDKFHVLQLFSKALSRVRIDAMGDDRKNPIRTLLLRNRKDLEAYEVKVLQFWLNMHLRARELYEYKEAMGRIYRMKPGSENLIL